MATDIGLIFLNVAIIRKACKLVGVPLLERARKENVRVEVAIFLEQTVGSHVTSPKKCLKSR